MNFKYRPYDPNAKDLLGRPQYFSTCCERIFLDSNAIYTGMIRANLLNKKAVPRSQFSAKRQLDWGGDGSFRLYYRGLERNHHLGIVYELAPYQKRNTEDAQSKLAELLKIKLKGFVGQENTPAVREEAAQTVRGFVAGYPLGNVWTVVPSVAARLT